MQAPRSKRLFASIVTSGLRLGTEIRDERPPPTVRLQCGRARLARFAFLAAGVVFSVGCEMPYMHVGADVWFVDISAPSDIWFRDISAPRDVWYADISTDVRWDVSEQDAAVDAPDVTSNDADTDADVAE